MNNNDDQQIKTQYDMILSDYAALLEQHIELLNQLFDNTTQNTINNRTQPSRCDDDERWKTYNDKMDDLLQDKYYRTRYFINIIERHQPSYKILGVSYLSNQINMEIDDINFLRDQAVNFAPNLAKIVQRLGITECLYKLVQGHSGNITRFYLLQRKIQQMANIKGFFDCIPETVFNENDEIIQEQSELLGRVYSVIESKFQTDMPQYEAINLICGIVEDICIVRGCKQENLNSQESSEDPTFSNAEGSEMADKLQNQKVGTVNSVDQSNHKNDALIQNPVTNITNNSSASNNSCCRLISKTSKRIAKVVKQTPKMLAGSLQKDKILCVADATPIQTDAQIVTQEDKVLLESAQIVNIFIHFQQVFVQDTQQDNNPIFENDAKNHDVTCEQIKKELFITRGEFEKFARLIIDVMKDYSCRHIKYLRQITILTELIAKTDVGNVITDTCFEVMMVKMRCVMQYLVTKDILVVIQDADQICDKYLCLSINAEKNASEIFLLGLKEVTTGLTNQ